MRLISYKKLSRNDKNFLIAAKNAAEHSVTLKKHKIGCTILCSDGSIYLGATVARTRAVGSTCAERMALDRWYFGDTKTDPQTCYLIGTLDRTSWRDDFVCTPCGVCLEMFLGLLVERDLKSLRFVCSNWKLSRALIADLSELFPQVGKGGRPYVKYLGIR